MTFYELYKKVFKQNGLYFLFFFLFVLITTGMDIMNFEVPRGQGFFSIRENHIDGWHLFKLIGFVLIVASYIINNWKNIRSGRELIYIIIIYVLIAFLPHEYLLHQIF